MVVTYRVNPISAWIFRRLSTTKFANLVNILLQKELIPELLQELCTPLALASASASLFSDEARKTAQKEAAKEALATLVPKGDMPSAIAAKTILSLF